MRDSPPVLGFIASLLVLFLGGGAIGSWLGDLLAPGSWVAQAVSFFALPVAFAAGLQAWYGVAIIGMVFRLLRWSVTAGAPPPTTRGIPGGFVFVPISSTAGIIAGLITGLVSPTHSTLFVVLVYWCVGTAHGLSAWLLARAGWLVPPETV
jgi:hypothetical protein